jgi:hypothetical protein
MFRKDGTEPICTFLAIPQAKLIRAINGLEYKI